ncbi:(d)CMP kinase [Candidatus Nomurabacteria bacterium]|nr:(d)CMP kinase [Candidatus Nomurabacteria bacterium]
MFKLLEKISSAKPKVRDVKFIAIDGRGGSGKSTLAKLLSKKLNAEIIRTDDFASWDNTLDWWPSIIEKIFQPIINGSKSLSYQPTSWWKDHHPKPITNQPVSNIIILEGLSSSRKEFQDYISFNIFVDTPKDICLIRGVERDVGDGKDREELTILWKKWLAEEDIYLNNYNPKNKASLVVDGTKPFEKQISFKD